MANPRQRKKARSSSHRPVSHSKHAKKNLKKMPPIRGPKILQDAWDKQKTVRQNYAALGLIHDLNPSAPGGSEMERASGNSDNMGLTKEVASTSQAIFSAPASAIPKGHGRILRDDSGNIIGVEVADEDEDEKDTEKDTDEDVDMERLAPELPANVLNTWVTELGGRRNSLANDTSVVHALEKIAATTSLNHSNQMATISASLTGAGPRHASRGERLYLQRLVDKYGLEDDGMEMMARDRKLNSEQRTCGELKRALKRAGFIADSM